MNCVSYCLNGSLSLSRGQKSEAVSEGSTNLSRRAFILKGSALALGIVGAGHFFGGLGGPIRSLARTNRSMEGAILPPGAMDAEHFMAKCTSCQLCTLNCPTKVIQPSPYVLGPVHLEFDHGACHLDCTLCNAICPSGALQPLSLEDKQWLKIGEASCDTPKCRVIKENIACALCIKACPKDAIFTLPASNGLEVPEVAAFHCIGCGACQFVCPTTPKAITVTGTAQTLN
jgi:ferredoxin